MDLSGILENAFTFIVIVIVVIIAINNKRTSQFVLFFSGRFAALAVFRSPHKEKNEIQSQPLSQCD